MKKLILLALMPFSCYGNIEIKESFLRKLLCCLCPCIKKSPTSELKRSHRCMDLKNIKDDYKSKMAGKIIEVYKESNDYINEEQFSDDVMEPKNKRIGDFGPLSN